MIITYNTSGILTRPRGLEVAPRRPEDPHNNNSNNDSSNNNNKKE